MQTWEYCTLRYETLQKESKPSSKPVIKIAKTKIEYYEEGKVREKRLFRHIYPKGDEITKAIAFLGREG
jgi:hypothetical protein